VGYSILIIGRIRHPNPTMKTTTNRYRYNSKEQLAEVEAIDYGARLYSTELCHWLQVDPLAEKYKSLSSYNFCANNPLKFVDVDGCEPTIAEAARIAAHVYGDKPDDFLIGGWSMSSNIMLGQKFNLDNGLKSALYERTIDGVTEYVYATAGTNDMKDVINDIVQPLGISNQYRQAAENAKDLSRMLREKELTFVGHSLGGGEAALNAMVTERKAITFNAAGVSNITKAANKSMKNIVKPIVHYSKN